MFTEHDISNLYNLVKHLSYISLAHHTLIAVIPGRMAAGGGEPETRVALNNRRLNHIPH